MVGTAPSRDDRGESKKQESQTRIRRNAKVSVPLTAMIDVTFLLLAYFLMTTTFRQSEGQLPGTLPKTGPIDDRPRVQPVEIALKVRAIGSACENAVYSIKGDRTPMRTPQELAERLRTMKKQAGEDAIVVIQAGTSVRWRYIVEACNQAAKVKLQSTIGI